VSRGDHSDRYVDTAANSTTGYLVEFGPTQDIFRRPQNKATQQYINGVFS
jgi:ABC-type phosphate transport system ATPase subunit